MSPILGACSALAALTALAALPGCASAQPRTGSPCPLAAPVAFDAGGKVFTHVEVGPHGPATRRKAMLAALSQGLQPLGIRISAESTSFEGERVVEEAGRLVSNEFVSDVQSFVRARFDEVEVRDLHVQYCQPPGDEEAVRATVRLPAAEWRRIARVKAGRTLVVVACASDPAGGCDEAVSQGVRQAADEAGLAVGSVIPAPPGFSSANAGDVMEAGVKHDAAFVMVVELSARVVGQEGGVVYASTEAFATLTETSDGRTLQTWKPGGGGSRPFKAGAYADQGGAPQALRASLKKAVHGDRRQEGLVQAARGWRRTAPPGRPGRR